MRREDAFRLAIVGSVSLAGNREAVHLIGEAIDLYRPAVVVSGGAKGIDSMAADIARARGLEVVVFKPRVPRWADGYKPRNLLIAKDCNALVRIVASNSKTYGSGWTMERAAEMGKPVHNWVVNVAP